MYLLGVQLRKPTTSTHSNNENVDQSVNMGPLEVGLAGVHHQLRVLTREYDNSIAPLGVSQHAASQHDLVVVQGVRFSIPFHATLKLGQSVIGWFA